MLTPHTTKRTAVEAFHLKDADILLKPSTRTRDEILAATPEFWAMRDVSNAVVQMTRRYPHEMKLLDRLGVHPLSSTDMVNHFMGDGVMHPGHRRNIGVHVLGVALNAEILGAAILGNERTCTQAVRLGLRHDTLKRIEVMKQEYLRATTMGGDRLSEDSFFLDVLGRYGVSRKNAELLVRARDKTDSEKCITRLLRADSRTGEVSIAEGFLVLKTVLLSDYLNATSGPAEDPVWTRNVTPAEKPTVSKWVELYPGLSNRGYGVSLSDNKIVQVPDLQNAPQDVIILGDHLAVQRYVGMAICQQFARVIKPGSMEDPGKIVKDFVNSPQ